MQWNLSIHPIIVCPACSIPLYRIARSRARDGLFSLAGCFPWQCQNVIAYGTVSSVAKLVVEPLVRVEVDVKHSSATLVTLESSKAQ